MLSSDELASILSAHDLSLIHILIMAMLPNDLVDEYISCIEKATGKGSAYRMSIRPYGAVCVSELI